MIENYLPVTKTAHPDHDAIDSFFNIRPLIGVYLTIDSSSAFKPASIRDLIELVVEHQGHPPTCYLLLVLGHKGRVDARLFADAALTTPLPLNLEEDGDLYPVQVNR